MNKAGINNILILSLHSVKQVLENCIPSVIMSVHLGNVKMYIMKITKIVQTYFYCIYSNLPFLTCNNLYQLGPDQAPDTVELYPPIAADIKR